MGLKFMELIGHLLESDGLYRKRNARVMPILRIAAAFLVILLCALSQNAFFTVSIIAVLLARLAAMEASAIASVLKRMALPVLFTMVLMLPAVFLGNPRSMLTVTMKVFESLLVLGILNEELSWKEITGSLESLHLSGIAVMTLDTAIRFLVILGRFANRMSEAVSLRRVGKKNWRNAGTGGILGTVFLKSQQMSARTSEAMRCRCFDGKYQHHGKRKPGAADACYALLIPLLVIWFLYTSRVHGV
ncbi:MAG: energy-coupling factor transporter transmembrane component T family protein [Lachnospiraceae bacterium]|jgi:cobalt/nickel transport system permease protein